MSDRELLGTRLKFTLDKDADGKDQLNILDKKDGMLCFRTRDLGKTLLAIERAHGKEKDT